MRRRDILKLGALSAAAMVSPAPAQERYPSRPVRLVIPSVPAGVHDLIGRVWAERIKPIFGTIVIDNRGGGGGAIGATEVAHAQGDGYTLLMGSTTTQVLVPPAMASPPYDPVKDFSAVAAVGYTSISIVAHPAVPAGSLGELIAYARANPGKLSYGSAGNGSSSNLAGELFKRLAGGLDIVHVPYKGIGQVTLDLVSGQIPLMSANVTAHTLDLHRSGKARIVSVHSQERLKAAPDIPTSIEAGLPDMLAQTTFGVFAPAGTPRAIIDRLNAVTQQVLADAAFQRELLRLGFEPLPGIGPEPTAALFEDERARWTPILQAIKGAPG